jgi:NodT family efflux transporter outer membrane factor (OMF) lipoprotein
MKRKIGLGFVVFLFLVGCTVGPNYKQPKIFVPEHYKEAPAGWKFATPNDTFSMHWWTVFDDPILDELEGKLNISNQNIALAYAQYMQARAQVTQARSAYYPVVSANASVTREKSAASSNRSESTISGLGPGIQTLSVGKPFTNYHLELDASWAPDIWGAVSRSVESSVANAQASAAQVAAVALLTQASLAQYYFELRGLDGDQRVLNETVNHYKKLLQITTNQYRAGTVSRANVLQTQSQLELAEVQAIDVGILRAQYEHAIATLIGVPPSCLTISPQNKILRPPAIPLEIPCTLLERRPDIAQAERSVASANAKIGVAIAAYFPVLTLTGTGGFNSTSLSTLFSKPAQFWSLGAQLADVIFDGGLRRGQVDEAKAVYCQTVAQYRQTVLAAFQEVEDNLVALRILALEREKQAEAVKTAQKSLDVVLNGYKAGTIPFADVLNAEITLNTAEKGLIDIAYRQMIAAVILIRALGGGWDVSHLSSALSEDCPPKKHCRKR